MPLSYYDPTADVDAATEIANLRQDCAEAHAMVDVQRQVIAELRDQLAGVKLERTVLTFALSQVVDITKRERRRGNTYRQRALALMRRVSEERTWAEFYQAETDRMRLEALTRAVVEG